MRNMVNIKISVRSAFCLNFKSIFLSIYNIQLELASYIQILDSFIMKEEVVVVIHLTLKFTKIIVTSIVNVNLLNMLLEVKITKTL